MPRRSLAAPDYVTPYHVVTTLFPKGVVRFLPVSGNLVIISIWELAHAAKGQDMDAYGMNRRELDAYGEDRLLICHEIGKETFRFCTESMGIALGTGGFKHHPAFDEIRDWNDIHILARDHADDMIFQGMPYGPCGDTIEIMTHEEREIARRGVAFAFAQTEIDVF